jgi:hypothetical protein
MLAQACGVKAFLPIMASAEQAGDAFTDVAFPEAVSSSANIACAKRWCETPPANAVE